MPRHRPHEAERRHEQHWRALLGGHAENPPRPSLHRILLRWLARIFGSVFVLALAYFWFYSRHHLVASAPEEEFAAIESGESDLH